MYSQKFEATLRSIAHAAKLDKGTMIKHTTLTFEVTFTEQIASGWGQLGEQVLEQIREGGLQSAGLQNDASVLIKIWGLSEEPEDALVLYGTGTGKARVMHVAEGYDPTLSLSFKIQTHSPTVARLVEHHMTTVRMTVDLSQTSMF
jgi:hypothetical protein